MPYFQLGMICPFRKLAGKEPQESTQKAGDTVPDAKKRPLKYNM